MEHLSFRAISIEDRQWIYSTGIIRFNDGTVIMKIDEKDDKSITTPVMPQTVGYSAGRKDRDGKDIYSGDIINRSFMDNYPNETGVIELRGSMFTISPNGEDFRPLSDDCGWCDLDNYYDCKGPLVIGTIHDHLIGK